MIKINLLAAEKPRAKKTWAPRLNLSGQSLTIGCAVIVVATLAGLGWRYWTVGQDAARLDLELAAAQQETQRLHSVIGEVQKFEQRRAQLQQRVGLIEQLRRDQTGPVHALDQISRAMPSMLWLTDLKQSPNSNEVVIDGRCAGLTGLSDFVANLESSGYFKRSVEIVSSQLESSGGMPGLTGDLIKFSIKVQFEPPSSAGAGNGQTAAAAGTPKPAT
jgi:type IV pilus assembly protein PilN